MRRTLNVILIAAALALGPAATASAQVTPRTLQLSAAPIMLATAAVTEAPAIGTASEATVPSIESWNPADWFKDAAVLGAVIAALVALLKANFLKNLHGLATLALSFGLGIAISLLGTINLPVIGRVNELTGMAAIMFGVNAAVFASGGWDVIKGLIMAALGGKSPGSAKAST